MDNTQVTPKEHALELFSNMLDKCGELKSATRLHDSCIIVETLQGVVLKFLLVANARPDINNAATVIVCLDNK